LQYSECKKPSGRRFVAAALQQNDDAVMTKASSWKRLPDFFVALIVGDAPRFSARITEQDPGRDGRRRCLE
jgi:hypothetical protein